MRATAAGLVGAISLAYLLAYELTPLIATGNTYYYIPILIWTALAGTIYYFHYRTFRSNILSWRFSKSTISNAVFVAVIQIIIFVIIGFVTQFSRNPMGSSTVSLALNSMLLVSSIMALEMGRSFLVRLLPKRRMGAGIALISLFFAVMLIPTTQFVFTGTTETIEFVGVYFLVALAQSIFATGLAIMGGPTSSLGYILTILAFGWLIPILPNPSWPIKSLLFTIAPVVGFLAVYMLSSPFRLISLGLLSRREMVSRPFKKGGGYSGWIVVLIIFTVLVWFQSGAFGAQPLVVVSGSMSPSIDVGDIIITLPSQVKDINVGDVISYRIESLPAPVVHRVVSVDRTTGSTIITTKGDALKEADRPIVISTGTVGKVAFTIPKIGWISIYAYEAIYSLAGVLNNIVVLGAVVTGTVAGLLLVLRRGSRFGVRR
jgi:signal peptidase